MNGWQYVPAFLRDGGAIVRTVNRAKPSKEELAGIFADSITPGMLALTDGLRSYNVFEDLGICQVAWATKEEGSFYNLNTVNGLHSYIKGMYDHYRGVATKYITTVTMQCSLLCSEAVRNYPQICFLPYVTQVLIGTGIV